MLSAIPRAAGAGVGVGEGARRTTVRIMTGRQPRLQVAAVVVAAAAKSQIGSSSNNNNSSSSSSSMAGRATARARKARKYSGTIKWLICTTPILIGAANGVDTAMTGEVTEGMDQEAATLVATRRRTPRGPMTVAGACTAIHTCSNSKPTTRSSRPPTPNRRMECRLTATRSSRFTQPIFR